MIMIIVVVHREAIMTFCGASDVHEGWWPRHRSDRRLDLRQWLWGQWWVSDTFWPGVCHQGFGVWLTQRPSHHLWQLSSMILSKLLPAANGNATWVFETFQLPSLLAAAKGQLWVEQLLRYSTSIHTQYVACQTKRCLKCRSFDAKHIHQTFRRCLSIRMLAVSYTIRKVFLFTVALRHQILEYVVARL